jgi:hypothetical protein
MKIVGGNNIEQNGDKNRASVTSTQDTRPRWYQRPVGQIIIGVIIIAIAAYLGLAT